MATFSIDMLRAAFAVRVRFNWERVLRKHAKVVPQVLSRVEEFQPFVHPWYVLASNPNAGWDWEGAHPVSVLKLADNPRLVTPERRKVIAEMKRILQRFHPPVQLTILAYSLPKGRQLILDGNHRMAAIARYKLPFTLVVLSIKGPIDGAIVPDLWHFRHGGVPTRLRLPVTDAGQPRRSIRER
jgi:hypothetical protein